MDAGGAWHGAMERQCPFEVNSVRPLDRRISVICYDITVSPQG
jgi:hypothetical protein